MDDSEELLSHLWDDLLSGKPEKVNTAFSLLPKRDQKAVLAHLKDMAEGEGWQSGQRESARTALQYLLTQ